MFCPICSAGRSRFTASDFDIVEVYKNLTFDIVYSPDATYICCAQLALLGIRYLCVQFGILIGLWKLSL